MDWQEQKRALSQESYFDSLTPEEVGKTFVTINYLVFRT